MKMSKRSKRNPIGSDPSNENKTDVISVTNLNEFKLKKCSVVLTRLTAEELRTCKINEIQKSLVDHQPETSKRMRQNDSKQDLLQTISVRKKKSEKSKVIATAAKSIENSVKLNCVPAPAPAIIKTQNFSESEIRKMANCSVVIKRFSPAVLAAHGIEKCCASSADDKQEPGTSKSLLQSDNVKTALHDTTNVTVRRMPKPFIIKTETISENESVNMLMGDDVRTAVSKKGGKRKPKKLLHFKMLNSNAKDAKAVNVQRNQASAPKFTAKSSKKANKKNTNKNEMKNMAANNGEDNNNNTLIPSSLAANKLKSQNRKRIPMQNIVSSIDDAIFNFEDLALVLIIIIIICCFRQISMVTLMHATINCHHPFLIQVKVSYIRQQNHQDCSQSMYAFAQFQNGVHQQNAAQTYKSSFFSNSENFLCYIVGN